MKSELIVSRSLIVAAFLGAALTVVGCSERARQETKEAGDAIADDAKAGADKAATQTKEAGRDIAGATKTAGREVADAASAAADKTKEVAHDVADATQRGVENAAEAGSDAWITTKVKAKFIDESVLKGSDINVDTSDHVVTLKGTVTSVAGKNRAESIAKGTDGVTRVVNQLVVKVKAG